RDRHAAYYTDLAALAEAQLHGPKQRDCLRRLDADAANLAAAFDHAVQDGAAERALRLAVGLVWYWFLRGRLTEARRCLRAALAVPGAAPDDLRARAVAWSAGIALQQGDAAEGVDLDLIDEPRAAWFLGAAVLSRGDVERGAELTERAL